MGGSWCFSPFFLVSFRGVVCAVGGEVATSFCGSVGGLCGGGGVGFGCGGGVWVGGWGFEAPMCMLRVYKQIQWCIVAVWALRFSTASTKTRRPASAPTTHGPPPGVARSPRTAPSTSAPPVTAPATTTSTRPAATVTAPARTPPPATTATAPATTTTTCALSATAPGTPPPHATTATAPARTPTAATATG